MDIQGHIIDHWVEKMLDHLAKLPDVRFLSSEEREKYDKVLRLADVMEQHGITQILVRPDLHKCM